jgi:hypothetical protein
VVFAVVVVTLLALAGGAVLLLRWLFAGFGGGM